MVQIPDLRGTTAMFTNGMMIHAGEPARKSYPEVDAVPEGLRCFHPFAIQFSLASNSLVRVRLKYKTHKALLLIGLVQPWVYLLAPLKLRSNTPFFVRLVCLFLKRCN